MSCDPTKYRYDVKEDSLWGALRDLYLSINGFQNDLADLYHRVDEPWAVESIGIQLERLENMRFDLRWCRRPLLDKYSNQIEADQTVNDAQMEASFQVADSYKILDQLIQLNSDLKMLDTLTAHLDMLRVSINTLMRCAGAGESLITDRPVVHNRTADRSPEPSSAGQPGPSGSGSPGPSVPSRGGPSSGRGRGGYPGGNFCGSGW